MFKVDFLLSLLSGLRFLSAWNSGVKTIQIVLPRLVSNFTFDVEPTYFFYRKLRRNLYLKTSVRFNQTAILLAEMSSHLGINCSH